MKDIPNDQSRALSEQPFLAIGAAWLGLDASGLGLEAGWYD